MYLIHSTHPHLTKCWKHILTPCIEYHAGLPYRRDNYQAGERLYLSNFAENAWTSIWILLYFEQFCVYYNRTSPNTHSEQEHPCELCSLKWVKQQSQRSIAHGNQRNKEKLNLISFESKGAVSTRFTGACIRAPSHQIAWKHCVCGGREGASRQQK